MTSLYPKADTESFCAPSAPPRQQGPEGSDALIKHTVTGADTLVGIALRYKVSVPDLKRVNNLSDNDIWMKKELLIPRTELPKNFQPMDPEMVRNAETSGKVTALVKAAGVDADVAREMLEESEFDFERTLRECVLVGRLVKSVGCRVDQREALAYLNMYQFDYEQAKQTLDEDLAWEDKNMSTGLFGTGNPERNGYRVMGGGEGGRAGRLRGLVEMTGTALFGAKKER